MSRWVASAAPGMATFALVAGTGCASLGASTGGSLSSTCSLSTESGTPGWGATFTNPTSYDITIESYTVLFFASSGQQTGSQEAVNSPFTVAASNAYSDQEYGLPRCRSAQHRAG